MSLKDLEFAFKHSLCDLMEGELDTEMLEIRDNLVKFKAVVVLVLWQSFIDQLDSNYCGVMGTDGELSGT